MGEGGGVGWGMAETDFLAMGVYHFPEAERVLRYLEGSGLRYEVEFSVRPSASHLSHAGEGSHVAVFVSCLRGDGNWRQLVGWK